MARKDGNFYSKNFYFKSKRQDYDAWFRSKKNTLENNKYAKIAVEINDIRIHRMSDKIIEVKFIQKYSSLSKKDKGIKIMRLEIYNNNYEIISEDWKKL